MREEIQEASVFCLLNIQRGRTDIIIIIAPLEDLWQH